MRFRDRQDAGERLAQVLVDLDLDRPVVLALPRGGVPVAGPIAAALRAPLDVLVARKVGAPGRPELGIGAVAEGGVTVADDRALRVLRVGRDDLAAAQAQARQELERRVATYRAGRPLPDVRGRPVLVVDDGLATGVTAEAAVRSVRALGPERVVLAVPVGSAEAVARLAAVADEVVCLATPPDFAAVGAWYGDFTQTTDAEVLDLLAR